jgi:hypothetical protein
MTTNQEGRKLILAHIWVAVLALAWRRRWP